MRTLTVARRKAIFGRSGKLALYVEDANAPETVILQTPCRKLGTLRNGEVRSFEITEESATLFVAFGKVRDGSCNEYFTIPAGTEPITLTGTCTYTLARGTAFHFDSENRRREPRRHRKGGHAAVILLAIAVLLAAASRINRLLDHMIHSPVTFEGSGYAITLNDEFVPMNLDGYMDVYEGDTATVMISKEPFLSPSDADTAVAAYAEVLRGLAAGGPDIAGCSELRTEGDLCYFDYMTIMDTVAYSYRVFVCKGSDGFRVIRIAAPIESFGAIQEDMMEWVRSFRAD